MLLLCYPFCVTIVQLCTGTFIEAPCTLVNSVRVLRCSARSLCERVCVPDVQPGATGVSCDSGRGNKTACALRFASLGCSAKWLHLLPSRIFLFLNIFISDKLCITKFAQKCSRSTSQVGRLIDCRQAGWLSRAALTIARIRLEKKFLSLRPCLQHFGSPK